jgi:RNA polymerase sigma-70 factor (ECF subfamily)
VNAERARFEQTVLPHLDAAYNLARWLTRNDHDADDVLQEAMLRAYRHFAGLRGEARPWLLAVVRNACWSWLQANRLAEVEPLDDAIADDSLPGPDAVLARTLDRRMLNEAIAALPVQFREVLVLRELEDLAYRDIARIAGIPIGTVMSRLARARRLLAESMRVAAMPRLRVHK